jgi:hypothetical protein
MTRTRRRRERPSRHWSGRRARVAHPGGLRRPHARSCVGAWMLALVAAVVVGRRVDAPVEAADCSLRPVAERDRSRLTVIARGHGRRPGCPPARDLDGCGGKRAAAGAIEIRRSDGDMSAAAEIGAVGRLSFAQSAAAVFRPSDGGSLDSCAVRASLQGSSHCSECNHASQRRSRSRSPRSRDRRKDRPPGRSRGSLRRRIFRQWSLLRCGAANATA